MVPCPACQGVQAAHMPGEVQVRDGVVCKVRRCPCGQVYLEPQVTERTCPKCGHVERSAQRPTGPTPAPLWVDPTKLGGLGLGDGFGG